jgi:hypothetical protein
LKKLAEPKEEPKEAKTIDEDPVLEDFEELSWT